MRFPDGVDRAMTIALPNTMRSDSNSREAGGEWRLRGSINDATTMRCGNG